MAGSLGSILALDSDTNRPEGVETAVEGDDTTVATRCGLSHAAEPKMVETAVHGARKNGAERGCNCSAAESAIKREAFDGSAINADLTAAKTSICNRLGGRRSIVATRIAQYHFGSTTLGRFRERGAAGKTCA